MTDYLYAHPGFLEGCARAVDLSGSLTAFNESFSPEEADFLALTADWQSVGLDVGNAINQFEAENAQANEASSG
jgi:hypothetical protein